MDKEFDRDLPLKQQISNNIEKLRKERGYTLVGLSEESGISKSTLSDYKNKKTLISPGNVEKLAEVFKVPKYMIDPSFKSKETSNLIEYPSSTVSLPIVGKISCGEGVFAYEDVEDYEETPKAWLNGGEYFYLRAKGDSMINARIHDGDLLLIRKQEEVESGEIAAVLVNDEAMLKRVYKTDNGLILQSENPKYPPIVVAEEQNVYIVGKLKRTVITY